MVQVFGNFNEIPMIHESRYAGSRRVKRSLAASEKGLARFYSSVATVDPSNTLHLPLNLVNEINVPDLSASPRSQIVH